MAFKDQAVIINEVERLERPHNVRDGLVDKTTLRVPRAAGIVALGEAAHWEAPVEEMPSRVIRYGSAIVRLLGAGEYFDFVSDVSTSRGEEVKQHIPLNFPRPGQATATMVIDHLKSMSEGQEVDLVVNSGDVAILDELLEEHEGIDQTDMFTLLAGFINHIGVTERDGATFVSYPDGDPRFKRDR